VFGSGTTLFKIASQSKHTAEIQIVNRFDNFAWSGKGTMMAMPASRYQQYILARSAILDATTKQLIREASTARGSALRYSSPWPWVLALAISCGMWAGIGWLIWTFV